MGLEKSLGKSVDIFPLESLQLPTKMYNDKHLVENARKDEVLLYSYLTNRNVIVGGCYAII